MPGRAERDYYARRALEVRNLASAATATDPDIRRTLDAMATSYDTLVAESDRIEHMRQRLPRG